MILSIYCGAHNGSVCVTNQGKIEYYAQEENFTSLKHDKAVWCSLLDIDKKFKHFDKVILGSLSSDVDWVRLQSMFYHGLFNFTWKEIIYENDVHHLHHAVLGFYHSGFDKAAVVVIDGHGIDGEAGTIILAEKPGIFHHEVQLKCNHLPGLVSICKSAGYVYEHATIKIPDWNWYDAGKLMGLAQCYGYEEQVDEKWREYIVHAHSTHMKAQELALDLLEQAEDLSDNLVLSGGYFLNCVSNYKFLKMFPHHNIFVEPIGYDAGISIGQAWYYDPPKLKKQVDTIYYGPNDTNYDIIDNYETYDTDYYEIAKLLEIGRPVAVFQGGIEAGPRALGNRSILFNPTDSRDKINELKGRENFRPLAGVIMEEYVHDWFDTAGLDKSPFMMYAMECKKKKEIPGVLHYNGTSRIQTVNKNQNWHLYSLLEEYYGQTRIPILGNTSFNLAGKSIVMTLQQAIDTLENSNIQYLWLPDIDRLMVWQHQK